MATWSTCFIWRILVIILFWHLLFNNRYAFGFNRVETHWDQTRYNGANSGRKAQIKQAAGDHTNGEAQFTQHIWIGFWLKIHNDYMRENTNTNAGLMQVWGYNGVSGAANHMLMLMLKFDGRNGGALVWQHRYNSVANKTHHLIYPNFPKDTFVRVVMHVKLAEPNNGLVQVWVNDELILNETNQTIGWGEQDASGMINGTYAFGTSTKHNKGHTPFWVSFCAECCRNTTKIRVMPLFKWVLYSHNKTARKTVRNRHPLI